MTAADWPAVARIYRAGIDGGDATFERDVPSFEEWSRARLPAPRLVARKAEEEEKTGEKETAGAVCGWAALSPVSGRAVYRGVGAVSIYVDPSSARQGIGHALLSALVESSEQRLGLWTLEAGIFPENHASVALHRRCGFVLVGVRRRVGQMPDGRWRDVALYERRSTTVGGDDRSELV